MPLFDGSICPTRRAIAAERCRLSIDQYDTSYPECAQQQWRNYNFAPPPGKHSLHSLITVLIHNSDHFGPLYRFGPLGPPALPGLPMASYATAQKETRRRPLLLLIDGTDRRTDARWSGSPRAVWAASKTQHTREWNRQAMSVNQCKIRTNDTAPLIDSSRSHSRLKTQERLPVSQILPTSP